MRTRRRTPLRTGTRTSLSLLGAATFAVIMVGVSAPANADQPTTPPTIDAPAPTTMAATVNLTGTLLPTGTGWGMVVDVWNLDVDPLNPVCTTNTSYADTTWTCAAVPLAEGTNELFAISYEDDGEPDQFSDAGPTVVVQRGGTAPVTIDDPFNNERVGDPTPVFYGSGPILGEVTVFGPSGAMCTTTVDEAGQWSCESGYALVPGTYSEIFADSTLLDGSPGTDTGFLSIDIIPLPPVMSYAMAAASVTATATGSSTGGVGIELYAVGDGGEGYSYTLISGCPAIAPTPDLFDDDMQFGGPVVTCTFSGLAPGIWNIYSGQTENGLNSFKQNDFVRIPTTPTIGARVTADRAVVISGLATDGTLVRVQTTGGTQVCQSAVAAGRWSCTVSPSAGTKRYVALAYEQSFVAASGGEGETVGASLQGISAVSATATVTVPVAPTTPPVAPLAARSPSFDFGGITELQPGDEFDVSGSDVPPGSTIAFELHSTPLPLGSTTANADGTFTYRIVIPADAEPGAHSIVAIVTPNDGTPATVVEQPVTLVVPATVVEEQPAESTGGAPALLTARQLPGAPTALTAGYTSPLDLVANPVVAVTAASLGLALVLVVVVVGEFFGEAIAVQYARFTQALGKRRRLAEATARVAAWITRHRLLTGGLLVVATSTVFSFVDPGFGLDLASLRLLLSCAISIILVNLVSSLITERIALLAWKVESRLTVMPWGLGVAVLGVILSRILDFSPGFLIGAILGLSVVGQVSPKLEARVILTRCAVLWVTAIGAWLLIGQIPTLPASDPASFFSSLATDTLVATSSAGLTALLVSLLPIALMDGGDLFAHSKRLWGIAFGVTVASFAAIVLPSAANWTDLGAGLGTWLLVTSIFIVLAIAAYIVARRRTLTTHGRTMREGA